MPSQIAQASAAEAESPFAIEELFFSRTNPAGIIKFSNSVFQRVSEYDWSELTERPHKIIRHPDTPRAIFEKLWSTIKAGAPVGAYVKNRAKGGGYYWVYAVVTPVEDGFLSVRLKPTSDLFPAVQSIYREAVQRERSERLTPSESLDAVEQRIAEAGFRDYRAFMAAALQRELQARTAAIGAPPDRVIDRFTDLLAAARELQTEAGRIAAAYDRYEYMPMNFQVQAAQLGQAGAAISAISTNYTLISARLSDAVRRFTASADAVETSIFDGLFLICTARLQSEMSCQFQAEDSACAPASEVARLEAQSRAYMQRATSGLLVIARQIETFKEECADMARLAAGLEVTRIMGKVESAKLIARELDTLLDELGEFQRQLSGGLKGLQLQNAAISSRTDEILAASHAG